MDCGNATPRELEAVTECHLFDIIDDATGEIYEENLLFAQAHIWAAEQRWTVVHWHGPDRGFPGGMYVIESDIEDDTSIYNLVT